MNVEYYYNKKTNEYEVKKVIYPSRFVYIYDEINGIPVTKIKKEAFVDNASIEVISLPNTITEIEKGAFMDCLSLEAFYYRGTFEDMNKVAIKRGNARLLSSSNMIALGDYGYVKKVLSRAFKNKESLLLSSKDVFPYQPINYLRVSIGQCLIENNIKYCLYECGAMDSDDESDPHLFDLPSYKYDCVLLDLIDYKFEDRYITQIQNLIMQCEQHNILVIALESQENSTNKELRKFFKHKICLNNEEELHQITSLIKKERRISISTLQRILSVGYIKARELFQQLIDKEYLSITNKGYEIVNREKVE